LDPKIKTKLKLYKKKKKKVKKVEIRAIRGFDKKEIGKVILVGPGSRACHVLLNSVNFNSILASGGNGRAIGLV
jgi:hypothetical protein